MEEIINAEELPSLSEEILIKAYTKAMHLKEEIEATMSVIKDEMTTRLDEQGVKGKVVGEYSVTKAQRVVFRTTIEQAKELGAVKEAVDTVVLKRLYDSGAPVPNTSVTTYLLVKLLEKGGEETK